MNIGHLHGLKTGSCIAKSLVNTSELVVITQETDVSQYYQGLFPLLF